MGRCGAFKNGRVYIICVLIGTLILPQICAQDEEDFLGSLDTTDITNRGLNPKSNEVELKCHTSSMCVHLDKEWLEEQWGISSIRQLSLRQRCDSSAEETETEIILCTLKGKLGSCGSEFTQNDTHVWFHNNVHILLLSSLAGIIPTVKASIPWTCTYPLKLMVGMKFVPQISPVTVFLGNKTGQGAFEAAMFLYKDDEFLHSYESVPHLHITDRLRVKVQLLRGPASSRIQVVKCWGTPVAVPRDGDLSYTVIEDYCPSEEGEKADVKLRNNGDEQHVLWESNVFRFIVSPEVYIHCHVKVCFDGTGCEKTCNVGGEGNNRRRREVTDTIGTGLLLLGPIAVDNDVPEIAASLQAPDLKEEEATVSAPENTEDSTILGMPRTAVFIMIAALAAICLTMTIGVGAGIYRKTRKRNREKSEQFWREQVASRCRLSARFTLSNAPPFEIPLSVPNTIATPERRSSDTPQ